MHAGDGAAVLSCTARGRRRVGRKLCTANTGAHNRATRAVWLMVDKNQSVEKRVPETRCALRRWPKGDVHNQFFADFERFAVYKR